jgi:hypothetical protein
VRSRGAPVSYSTESPGKGFHPLLIESFVFSAHS